MTNLLPYAVAWGVLAIVVIALAVMRKMISAKEDDTLHLSGEAGVIEQQTTVARKLEAVDKWGRILTIVLVVTGLILAVLYGLELWEASSRAGLG